MRALLLQLLRFRPQYYLAMACSFQAACVTKDASLVQGSDEKRQQVIDSSLKRALSRTMHHDLGECYWQALSSRSDGYAKCGGDSVIDWIAAQHIVWSLSHETRGVSPKNIKSGGKHSFHTLWKNYQSQRANWKRSFHDLITQDLGRSNIPSAPRLKSFITPNSKLIDFGSGTQFEKRYRSWLKGVPHNQTKQYGIAYESITLSHTNSAAITPTNPYLLKLTRQTIQPNKFYIDDARLLLGPDAIIQVRFRWPTIGSSKAYFKDVSDFKQIEPLQVPEDQSSIWQSRINSQLNHLCQSWFQKSHVSRIHSLCRNLNTLEDLDGVLGRTLLEHHFRGRIPEILRHDASITMQLLNWFWNSRFSTYDFDDPRTELNEDKSDILMRVLFSIADERSKS